LGGKCDEMGCDDLSDVKNSPLKPTLLNLENGYLEDDDFSGINHN